ncbi:MAG: acyl-CoA carboxylase subunit beta [Chloroflexota bacterium]
MDSNLRKLEELRRRKSRILQMGGARQTEQQHSMGKLTARERIDRLLDSGTFQEIDPLVKHRCSAFGMEGKELPADAIVTGYGKVSGRPVFVAAEDFTVAAGTYGEMHGKKACKAIDLALAARCPFIMMIDSGGARLQEGQDSSEWYALLFRRHTLCNGVIPQVSLLLGHCGGGAAYGPALTDFIIMARRTAFMYMGGPAFVKTMLGYEATADELGGAEVHSRITGLADLVAEDDAHAMELTKELLSYLPSHSGERPQWLDTGDTAPRANKGILGLLPDDSRAPFDMCKLILQVVDNGHMLQVKRDFAPNMITGFARLGGHSVGIVANQSTVKGGVIDVDASDKLARFVRICDSFNVPLVQFQDSPAVMIGRDEEYKGIIRHGSKMLYAYTEATVPKVTLVVRHSYAGAQLSMCNKPIGADLMFAWPTAEIALVGPATAASVLYAKEIAAAANPEEVKARRIAEYAEYYVNPYVAAERGYIDDVIEPEETRARLIATLEVLQNKQDHRPEKKHGNLQM